MNQLIWKKCGESSNLIYDVSNHGNVRSVSKISNEIVTILKPIHHTSGYLCVNIDRKRKMIAHLVAQSFIGKRPFGFVVDHIDRNRYNNRYDNLRYCSIALNNLNTSEKGKGIPYPEKEKQRMREQSRKRHAQKIQCDCGSITDKVHQYRHRKSKKHQNYLKTLQ